MSEVVLLVSTLLLSQLQDHYQAVSPQKEMAKPSEQAANVMAAIEKCGGMINPALSTANPDEEDTHFLTISVAHHADACVNALTPFEGVRAAYVKPGVSSP